MHFLIRKLYPSVIVLGNAGLPKVSETNSQKLIPMGGAIVLHSAYILHIVKDKSHFGNRLLVNKSTDSEGTYLMEACSFSHRTVSTETRSSQRASTVDSANRLLDISRHTRRSLNGPSHPPFYVFRTKKVIFRC